MSPAKFHRQKSNPNHEFRGSVELITPPPTDIEFVVEDRVDRLPYCELAQVDYYHNPDPALNDTRTPDLLMLIFQAQVVGIFGWGLEVLANPLSEGRVKRIHAEEHPGALMVETPWVSEILILRKNEPFPAKLRVI
jgi:hypothetical protein